MAKQRGKSNIFDKLDPRKGKGIKTSKKNIIIISILGVLTTCMLGGSIYFAYISGAFR